jgi:hypothetical protein
VNTPKPENVAAACARINALNERGTLQAAHAADRLTASADSPYAYGTGARKS